MARRNYIVATAGHVDHGKSSLVKALTQTDPDRLPEEKKRGITIDLGFAYLEVATDEMTADIGIIDVPGHEDFVKNMVTGVGAADAALLVVAADDGWMPQTEEHLQILSYLGVPRLLVALTKVDLPDADPELVEEIIREELNSTPYADAEIVRTSVAGAPGVSEIAARLARLLAGSPARDTSDRPQLWVDRAFTMHGIGTVVTGTLEKGTLATGQSVTIQPRNTPARIRGLQTFGSSVELAHPGRRVAVNLPDIDLSASSGKPFIQRGDVIADGKATDVVDVVITKSSRQISPKSPANNPLKHDSRVRVHIGTGNFIGKVILFDAKEISPGESAIAELRFETPIFCCDGDRFTIRDWSESATLAGGLVLESTAKAHRFRSERQQSFLRHRHNFHQDATEWLASQLERDGFCHRSDAPAVGILIDDGRAFVFGDTLVSTNWWQEQQQKSIRWITEELAKDPAMAGIPIGNLRNHLKKQIGEESIITKLMDMLCQDQLARSGDLLSPPGHKAELSAGMSADVERIRSLIAANRREPPSRPQLADSPETERALKYLIDAGELTVLDHNTVLPTEIRNEMAAIIKDHLLAKEACTTSELRTAINTSRRIAMPLLEQLDRSGITQRIGDNRRLTAKGKATD